MSSARTGIANLPLHYGKAPRWLFERMVKLAREINIAIVADFWAEERISDVWSRAGTLSMRAVK